MSAGVALINPKYPFNVSGSLRACSNWGAEYLTWTPERIKHPDDWPKGVRLPREERMKLYAQVAILCTGREMIVETGNTLGLTPIAVEVRDNAEPLPTFIHPEDALYVFGPEDGSLGKGILAACHRFLVLPSTSCLNLAAAVNVVLYDRVAKSGEWPLPTETRMYAEVDG